MYIYNQLSCIILLSMIVITEIYKVINKKIFYSYPGYGKEEW